MIRSAHTSHDARSDMRLPLPVLTTKVKKKCCKKYLKKSKYCKSCPKKAKQK